VSDTGVLLDEVREHRRKAKYLRDRIEDECRDGDAARDRLVAFVGEDEARRLVGEDDWEGDWP